MRYLFVLIVLVYSFNSSAQQKRDIVPSKIPINEYGYIDGIRLDSINVKYAQVHLEFGSAFVAFPYLDKHAESNVYFVYGQKWNKKQDLRITDCNGNAIIFSYLSLARVLNFLDYNGWKLVKLVGTVLIMEKKQDEIK